MEVKAGARRSGRTSFIIEEFLKDPRGSFIITASEVEARDVRQRLIDWGIAPDIAKRHVRNYQNQGQAWRGVPRLRILADNWDYMDKSRLGFSEEWVDVATVEG